jgi:hypothetical protein
VELSPPRFGVPVETPTQRDESVPYGFVHVGRYHTPAT